MTYAVPNLTYAAGDELSIRVGVVGSGTTQLLGKVWKSGEPEPSGWQLAASDAAPELQVAGSSGFRINRSGTSATPVVVSIDALRVNAIG
jgi:hypothetical protein